MSKLYFMNNGYFDARAMMTFGVNVKEGDNPIGQFGTGFKYAIAIILRIGGSISVHTKNEEGITEIITFRKSTETIRGKEFDFVKMNDADIGFTTHLGINWEPWQAYRELYSNCKDEDGVVADKMEGGYDTMVHVDCQAIFNAWYNKDTYFISGEPVFANHHIEIYEQQLPFFYYQGIAVADCGDSLYAYNVVSSIQLTEDRTAKYKHEITGKIETTFQRMDDRKLLRSVLGSKKNFEAKLDYSTAITPSDEFVEVAIGLQKSGRGVNDSARLVLKKYKQRNTEYVGRPISPVEQKMMDKSKRFLKGIGINVEDYEILVVDGLGEGILGRALEGKIYISGEIFEKGTKYLASTLMEEWVHIKYETGDFTRTMQTWLFDKILSIGEQINGEPL